MQLHFVITHYKIQKEEKMNFNEIKTPHELMKWMNEYFEYGVLDNNGVKHTDGEGFRKANKHWKVRSALDIIKSGVGHCYDQTELERYWFRKNGYKVKTFFVVAFYENNADAHSYLAYFDKNKWYYFEHSDYNNRGIYEFDNLQNLVKFQAKKHLEHAKEHVKSGEYSIKTTCFKKPKVGTTIQKYREIALSSKTYLDYNVTKQNNI